MVVGWGEVGGGGGVGVVTGDGGGSGRKGGRRRPTGPPGLWGAALGVGPPPGPRPAPRAATAGSGGGVWPVTRPPSLRDCGQDDHVGGGGVGGRVGRGGVGGGAGRRLCASQCFIGFYWFGKRWVGVDSLLGVWVGSDPATKPIQCVFFSIYGTTEHGSTYVGRKKTAQKKQKKRLDQGHVQMVCTDTAQGQPIQGTTAMSTRGEERTAGRKQT